MLRGAYRIHSKLFRFIQDPPNLLPPILQFYVLLFPNLYFLHQLCWTLFPVHPKPPPSCTTCTCFLLPTAAHPSSSSSKDTQLFIFSQNMSHWQSSHLLAHLSPPGGCELGISLIFETQNPLNTVIHLAQNKYTTSASLYYKCIWPTIVFSFVKCKQW